MAQYIEQYFSQVLYAGGINTLKPATFGSTVSTGALTTTTISATTIAGSTVTATSTVTGKSATAVPATAGAVAAGAPISLNSNGITIECTTDVPTHTRVKGSICINLGGTTTNNRIYVATDSAGTWTALTTAA